MIMMTLSMVMMCISLSFYDWLIAVRCIGLGWVWVGLGQLFGWLGRVWVDDMDPLRYGPTDNSVITLQRT